VPNVAGAGIFNGRWSRETPSRGRCLTCCGLAERFPHRRTTSVTAQLCEHLTATQTRYPGTELILR
jgi:hypothetical protein